MAVEPRDGVLGHVGRVVAHHIAARLGKDGQVLVVALTQAIDGVDEELVVEGDLVVIEEHADVVAEDACDHEAHVVDGTIAAQRDGLAIHVGNDSRDGIVDQGRLRRTDDQWVERRVPATDVHDPGARRCLAGKRGDDEHDDANDATHLLERVQAGLELGQGLVVGRRVVVRAQLAQLAGLVGRCPV